MDRLAFRAANSAFLALLLLAGGFLLAPGTARASHDLGQSCYVCHNIQLGTTWSGSYSIWTGKSIGMSAPTGGKPVNCDICHVEHGRMFDNTALGGSEKSAHPVLIIDNATTTAFFPGYGTQIRCLDCHKGDTYDPSPTYTNLNPDVSPSAWDTKGSNTGYPNHDVASPNNQVSIGVDPPHLTGAYDNTPVTASTASAQYALCFLCHGSDLSKRSHDNVDVATDYASGGHFFQGGRGRGR